MVDSAKLDAGELEEQPTNDDTGAGGMGRLRHLLHKPWARTVLIVVVVSLVIQGGSALCYKVFRDQAPSDISREISLGTFHFEAEAEGAGQIAAAEFALHIALLDQVDIQAQQRIEARKYRVQQDIEELLRQAHSGDFEDPTLGELKRALQAQVNQTLDMRAIADVIITDLQLKHRPRQPVDPATETADLAPTPPWVDPSTSTAGGQGSSG